MIFTRRTPTEDLSNVKNNSHAESSMQQRGLKLKRGTPHDTRVQ
jgi:hypothetical protein